MRLPYKRYLVRFLTAADTKTFVDVGEVLTTSASSGIWKNMGSLLLNKQYNAKNNITTFLTKTLYTFVPNRWSSSQIFRLKILWHSENNCVFSPLWNMSLYEFPKKRTSTEAMKTICDVHPDSVKPYTCLNGLKMAIATYPTSLSPVDEPLWMTPFRWDYCIGSTSKHQGFST